MMSDGLTGPVSGLTILDDPCAGCGACCEYMGAPPGYAPAYLAEDEAPAGWWQTDDGRAFQAMPAEIRDPLDAYFRAVREGAIEDREQQADPCLWYDPTTRRCLHYEWRPSPCRAFEAGGDDCRGVREYAWR